MKRYSEKRDTFYKGQKSKIDNETSPDCSTGLIIIIIFIIIIY